VFVEDDPRYDYPCRLGLLAVAALHWIIFALLVRGHPDAPATGESSVEELGHFASEMLRAVAGVA
jgi:hypothetical protein